MCGAKWAKNIAESNKKMHTVIVNKQKKHNGN